jgi:lipase
VRLHAHVWGEGPPVVCVHGVTGHGERFRLLAERLAGRRTIAVDLRGHGRSGGEPPWNLETHVDDLVEAAHAHGAERAPWIGFSFGGRLVAELAVREPRLVERLALLDPALQLPADVALEAATDELSEETFASADDAIAARVAAGTLISTPREYLEEEMRQHLEPAPDGRLRYRYSRPAAIAAWGEMARPAPEPARVPTLLLVGSESYVPNPAARYRETLGDLVTVREIHSGHSLLWDDFDATAAEVAAFFGRS